MAATVRYAKSVLLPSGLISAYMGLFVVGLSGILEICHGVGKVSSGLWLMQVEDVSYIGSYYYLE
jgi:hypothetical protein